MALGGLSVPACSYLYAHLEPSSSPHKEPMSASHNGYLTEPTGIAKRLHKDSIKAYRLFSLGMT